MNELEEAAAHWRGVDDIPERDLTAMLHPYEQARQAKAEADTVMKFISDLLKEWLDKHPGDELVDGERKLRAFLQERRGTPTYDLITLHENDPLLFARLLKSGCLSVNHAAVKAQKEQVGGVDRYAFPAPVTVSLQVKSVK